MANFGKSFSESFDKSMAVSQAGTLDLIKEKIKLDAEKSTKATKTANFLSMTTDLVKDADPATQERVGKMISDDTKSWDEDSAKALFELTKSSVEDKIKQSVNLNLEGYKGAMAGITEITKSMAERGGQTPAQLLEIQNQAAQKVRTMYGLPALENQTTEEKIVGGKTSTQPTTDFFNQPIQPKKTEKQLDQEKAMQRGSELIDMMEENYNKISEKYGTGRLKGIATTLRGGLGDILPKREQAPEVKPYLGNLDGIAQFVGRNVYNDDRVSNEDRKAYRKSLAEITASPDEAKIFFSTLRRFTKTGNARDQEAIRMIVDKSGKGMLPSVAVAIANGDTSKLTREQKIAVLEQRKAKK